MTARASAAFCSSPGPPIAIGIIPTIIAAAVISTGRIRVRPAEMAASKALIPASCCSRAKVTSRIELAEATPTAMIAPNASWRRVQLGGLPMSGQQFGDLLGRVIGDAGQAYR